MEPKFSQLSLPLSDFTPRQSNKLDTQDRAFHEWYRFVLSFPAHLVRDYVRDFQLAENQIVLDPFCGTGTTLVEAKLNLLRTLGLEANPFAHFASSVKTDWGVNPDELIAQATDAATSASALLRAQGIDDSYPFTGNLQDIPLKTLDQDATKLLLKNSISPLPLHKTLTLLICLNKHQPQPGYGHLLLALAKVLVFSISNLHFGPEVGVKGYKFDTPVIAPWLAEVRRIANDLRLTLGQSYPDSKVYLGDARQISHIIPPHSVDAVITSPPYPNEKDYTRTTRLESVIFGFITNKAELKSSKDNFIRSNTRGVYRDDNDDQWIVHHSEIQQIADVIERRRIELGKTSGFEKLYGRVTRLYFGGMKRHLAELRTVLKPGAKLAYVVGDQASYFRVMIRTGQLLAEVAETLGYELIRIDLFRTRFATATKEQLREEVVVLRWPG
jgi:DNA modification methylase